MDFHRNSSIIYYFTTINNKYTYCLNTIDRLISLFVFFSFYPSYPKALALVASGAVNVKPLITHHFKLEQSLDAFETSRTGAGGAIKVVIHCDEGYQL